MAEMAYLFYMSSGTCLGSYTGDPSWSSSCWRGSGWFSARSRASPNRCQAYSRTRTGSTRTWGCTHVGVPSSFESSWKKWWLYRRLPPWSWWPWSIDCSQGWRITHVGCCWKPPLCPSAPSSRCRFPGRVRSSAEGWSTGTRCCCRRVRILLVWNCFSLKNISCELWTMSEHLSLHLVSKTQPPTQVSSTSKKIYD